MMKMYGRKRGRPSELSSRERSRLLADSRFCSDRWKLDQHFKEITLHALGKEKENYPFVLPPNRKLRNSLLVELGRWGSPEAIQKTAMLIEQEAARNGKLSVKEAIHISRAARQQLKDELARQKKRTKEEAPPIISDSEPDAAKSLDDAQKEAALKMIFRRS